MNSKPRIRDWYRFRIELSYLEPAIWREIDVPPWYSFWDLHVAIQDAMGWADYHLHAFFVEEPRTGRRLSIGIPDSDFPYSRNPILAGWAIPVLAFLSEAGQSAEYEYDFGDSWTHRVTLQDTVAHESESKMPVCVAGERACPPEDCGGPPGYQRLLEIINDPLHEEYEEMMQWLGGSFDAEVFDPGSVRFDNPEARWKGAFE